MKLIFETEAVPYLHSSNQILYSNVEFSSIYYLTFKIARTGLPSQLL
ncbi:hypothetical protein BH23BAC3_BH23BAC3_22780 [soil metagenome]